MMQTKKTSEISNAVCRNCRFYQPNGHRGGICEQFNVPVSGAWSTCKLALPAFMPSWKTLEDLPAPNVMIPILAEESPLPVKVAAPVSQMGHQNN